MTATLDRALPAADAGVMADGKVADPDPEVPEADTPALVHREVQAGDPGLLRRGGAG